MPRTLSFTTTIQLLTPFACQIYLVYLPEGRDSSLDLRDGDGEFSIHWFNPRLGGDLQTSSIETVVGGNIVWLGEPPADKTEDWLVVIRTTR